MAIIWVSGAAPAGAQYVDAPELLADLRTEIEPTSSHPVPLHRIPATQPTGAKPDDTLLFVASDELYGSELWSLGPDGQPERLTDVCPGPCDSLNGFFRLPPSRLPDGRVLFVATAGDTSLELWVTDGSRQGTKRLTQPISSNRFETSVNALAETGLDGRIFFARQGELWQTDGTVDGTGPFDTGPLGLSSVDAVHRVADRLVVSGIRPGVGLELWASGGVAGDLQMLADLCAGPCSSFLYGVAGIRLDGDGVPAMLLIATRDSNGGVRVLATRGTANSTTTLVSGCSGFGCNDSFAGFDVVGDRLAFAVDDEVWLTDGTSLGTFSIADLDDAVGRVYAFGPAPGGVVVLGLDGATTEIYFVPVAAGQGGTPVLLASSDSFVEHYGAIQPEGPMVFGARDEFGGFKVWTSDGTVAGTNPLEAPDVPAFHSYPSDFAPWKDSLVFTAHDSQRGSELHVTDGTVAGSARLPDLAGTSLSSNPREFTQVGPRDVSGAGEGGVLFVADQSTSTDTREPDEAEGAGDLFVTGPGQPTPTLLLEARRAHGLTQVGDLVFFSALPDAATTPSLRRAGEPWVTDGTVGGTVLLGDLEPLAYGGSHPRDAVMLPSGDRFLFFADQGAGVKIWTSDGTPAGTELLVDLDPEWSNHHPDDPCGVCSVTSGMSSGMFSAEAPETTVSEKFHDVPVFPRDAHVVGDRVVFIGRNGLVGQELWVTDGTADGTETLLDITPGPDDTFVHHLVPMDGKLYFFVGPDSQFDSAELWVTDGTSDGTREVVGLVLADILEAVVFATHSGDRLAFSSRRDLWISDGTAAGTLHVWSSDHVGQLTPTDGYLFFATADDHLAAEVGVYDASNANLEGVHVLSGLAPGTSVASPRLLGALGPKLLLTATVDSRDPTLLELDAARSRFDFLPAAPNGEYLTLASEVRVVGDRLYVARTYFNGGGDLCGDADVTAFPDPFSSAAFPRAAWPGAASASPSPRIPARAHPGGDHCGPGSSSGASLCLGERFDVSVTWQTDEASGYGRPIPFSDETGMFWFFGEDNVELLVKILDGRAINGKFWVFYGALSDVAYEIRVVDTESGTARTYSNARGNLCGDADVDAFPP